MATNDQEAVSVGPSAILKGALAVAAIGGGLVFMHYVMKRINKLQEKSRLMMEILKEHSELLSQLKGKTDQLFVEMNKKQPAALNRTEILNSIILSIILSIIFNMATKMISSVLG